MNDSIAIKTNRNCRRAVRRQSRKSLFKAVILVLSIVTIVVFSLYKTTQAEEAASLHKYYKTIVIQPDDTLWEIAESYCVDEDEVETFISEIKTINQIGSDNIRAGMNLIIPYYGE